MPHITIKNVAKTTAVNIWNDAKASLMEVCDLPEARFIVDSIDNHAITSSPTIFNIQWIDRGVSKQAIVDALTDAAKNHGDVQVRVIFRDISNGVLFIDKEGK